MTIPSLVNRQDDVASKVRIKKSIANYEDVAAVYMIEESDRQKRDVKDLKDFAGPNCENVEKYFNINTMYSPCSFTTYDGVFWQVNPNDGSVIVADRYDSPRYIINMGVCENGQINCDAQFPQVREILNK